MVPPEAPSARRRAPRLALAVGSAALAIGLVWVLLPWLPRRPEPPTVALLESPDRQELFAREQSGARNSSRPPLDLDRDGPRSFEALHPPLDPAELRLFFPGVELLGMQPHPEGYVARTPDLRLPFPFADHPGGGFHVVTDARGLRRDGPIPAGTPRILVLGDSHVDGVLDNPDNLCALLERQLREAGRAHTVLNGAVGGTTFVNHLGALRRFADLEPAWVLVVVYGGNDFLDQARFERYVRGMDEPTDTRQVLRRVLDSPLPGARARSGFVSQELFQAVHFQANPGDESLAVEAAFELLWATQRECESMGARFAAVYLPPARRVEPAASAALVEECLGLAQVPAAALEVEERLQRALFARLSELGITAIDLTPSLAAEPGDNYWPSDLHLSIAGHRRAAEALFAALVPRLSRP